MVTFTDCRQFAVALLLAIVGLQARPVEAQSKPRLLFLGIIKDGRQQQAGHSVQLRLEGLGVQVMTPEQFDLCAQPDCLTAALATQNAELALLGRILRTDRACVATLWLSPDTGQQSPIAQDIACRPDSKDAELSATLADSAAAMVDEFLRNKEPAPAARNTIQHFSSTESYSFLSKGKQPWNWKKKFLIAGLGILLAGEIAATITFTTIRPITIENTEKRVPDLLLFRPEIAGAGILSGLTAASLFFLAFR